MTLFTNTCDVAFLKCLQKSFSLVSESNVPPTTEYEFSSVSKKDVPKTMNLRVRTTSGQISYVEIIDHSDSFRCYNTFESCIRAQNRTSSLK